MVSTMQALSQQLLRLDGQSYKAYKQIAGSYQFPGFILWIDHVQGDPFAAPSRFRVQVPQTVAQFPPSLYNTASRSIALRDYLNRSFDRLANVTQEQRGSGKSGLIAIASPRQQVLDRTAILIDQQQVEARFVVGLPARGRTIMGRQAAELICQDIPLIVDRALKFAALNAQAIEQHVDVVEDADWLRSQLASRNLVAFIPDGAILPRQSGADDKPLVKGALPFQSPPELRVEFDRPHQGKLTGMGIPKGVTLIVGGGYHGKSTVLKAIALGIYNHIPGDGREQLVTNANAVKIRAEDGRSIVGVDISPFINHLPQGRSTTDFSTTNASGSTSQAANIIEALEVGAEVLLVDEDTSATNFMIRDRRMQALIAKDKEPITPFIDKIRQLYSDYEVSTILVMGGSGDYFDVADTVIAMTEFEPSDVTQQARSIASQYTTERTAEGGDQFGKLKPRIPIAKRLDSPHERDRGWKRQGDFRRDFRRESRDDFRDDFRSESRSDFRSESRDDFRSESQGNSRGNFRNESQSDFRDAFRSPKTKVRDVDEMVFGTEAIDLSAVEQIVDVGQLRAIGAALTYLQDQYLDSKQSLSAIVDQFMAELAADHLDLLLPYLSGELVWFRSLELAAVLNRLRSLEMVED